MPDQSSPKSLTVLEGLKGFILWVGGSLAGITAILYACGYLVTRSHLSMLGLYGMVGYANDYFLQEGAKFAVSTGYRLVRTLLPIAVGAAVLVAGWLLLRSAVTVALGRRHPIEDVQTRTSASGKPLLVISNWLKAHSGVMRRLFYVLLIAALVLHADSYLGAFDRPLSVVNLLYESSVPVRSVIHDTPAEIERWILSDNRNCLTNAFEDLLFGGVLPVAVLALVTWRTVRPWQQRVWLAAPFFGALLIYLVMLPMAYGVLERPIRYPVVTLTTKTNIPRAKCETFLLALTGDAFVLYSRDRMKVEWIPINSVTSAEIRAVNDLFGQAKSKCMEGAQ